MGSAKTRFRTGLALVALALSGPLSAAELRVEALSGRGVDSAARADQAVRDFAVRTARLSERSRALQRRAGRMDVPFTLPVRVVLTENGRPLPGPTEFGIAATDITLRFDATGGRAFPGDYRNLLQQTFDSARPVMNAVFGAPARAGVVRVRNYDADIQDRYAVAGGYYVPNAPGGPEVRFPVYNNAVSAAVNLIHVLLLAYQGARPYPLDAFSEGLVRAAVMQIARTPGAIPGNPPSDQIEATLEALYDLSPNYDWLNQPGLGARSFIAPNLLNTPLPPGGSTGGAFLLRYQMAGSAWQKVTAEWPGFLAEFNRRYNLAPNAYQTVDALLALGQATLDFLRGSAGATVEGLSFRAWFERQHVLDTRVNAGLKVVPRVYPFPAQTGTDDFGVFAIELNAFRTAPNGHETLLQGSAYPLYWRPDFSRFFTTAQDDVISVTGGFGAVVPNFPRETFAGQPYRTTVDLPFGSRTARVFLPSGAVSTGQSPTPNNLYGTLAGFPASGTYRVTVQFVGGAQTGIVVQNGAFGVTVANLSFNRPQPVTVRVFRTVAGNQSEVLTRRVNKGFGALGLDLRPPSADQTVTVSRPNRLALVGPTGEPFRGNAADVLGLTDAETLVARWNPIAGRFGMYPDEGDLAGGLGYFVRARTAAVRTVPGRTMPNLPVAVALEPGWNIVAPPRNVSLSDIAVTTSTEALSTYTEARGDILGNTVFAFVPDPANPDGGTLRAVTALEAGRGYYVRANRPEGAVLVFPAGSPQALTARAGTDDDLLRKASRPAWETRLTLGTGKGAQADASVGAASGATRAYDPAWDTDLPPSPGGLQMMTLADRPLYRDIRAFGSPEGFRIRLTGLIPGRRYRLNIAPIQGQRPLTLVDAAARVERTAIAGDYWFTATGPTRDLEVRTGVGR